MVSSASSVAIIIYIAIYSRYAPFIWLCAVISGRIPVIGAVFTHVYDKDYLDENNSTV